MSKRIYRIGVEVNDKGWSFGYQHFENVADAIKFMRQCAAYEILKARSREAKVECLRVWKDSVMNEIPSVCSQSITFLVDEVPYDFRIWSVRLHSEPISLERTAYNF